MPSSDKVRVIDSTEDNLRTDYLSDLENQLKLLWSQYVSYLDRRGHDDRASALRDRYFHLYRYYRRNKNWKRALTNKP